MPPLLCFWTVVIATLGRGLGAEVQDVATLVQSVAHSTREFVGSATVPSKEGPMAYTPLGKVLGVHEADYDVFRGIPYVEMPKRFEKSTPKKPWGKTTLLATQFGPGCIGASTGVPEGEDCLNLNIWLPKGSKRNMPVIVYFHGGINQHGSGQEEARHGDLIVQFRRLPTIFINFDYRLGIFGWISSPETPHNLGFMDQQEALRWVQRNIASFGGDPHRVTLQGQSEGCGAILAHMVAPGSMMLFQRAAFHSPPADMWSRSANKERTEFMIRRLGCLRGDWHDTLLCLRTLPAQALWQGDWVAEELSRNVGSPSWSRNIYGLLLFRMGKSISDVAGMLGWHPVVDNVTLLGEPRELIRKGKWNKVPVLITTSKNESYGVFPGGGDTALQMLNQGFYRLLKFGEVDRVKWLYNQSLSRHGVHARDELDLGHQMMTDKMWACDCRMLAEDITASGGTAYLGMFWHSPKIDSMGKKTNAICENGATCHAVEMAYLLPQGRGVGLYGKGFDEEVKFMQRYTTGFLHFVHGLYHPWARYDLHTQPMTFFDTKRSYLVPGYRKPQCDILDASMGASLPFFMKRNRTRA